MNQLGEIPGRAHDNSRSKRISVCFQDPVHTICFVSKQETMANRIIALGPKSKEWVLLV
jgi:hypothetical protein